MVQIRSHPFALEYPKNKVIFKKDFQISACIQVYEGKTTGGEVIFNMTPIQPHENDVLMGRGGKNNQHSGNDKLREIARLHCEEYRMSTKKGKSLISRKLIQYMRELDPPARFLKRNTQTNFWEDVGDDAAREKASQVLRDAVASLFDPESTGRQSLSSAAPVEGILTLPSLDTSEESPCHSEPGLQSASSESFILPSPVASSRHKRARYYRQIEPRRAAHGFASHPPASPIRRHSESAATVSDPRRDSHGLSRLSRRRSSGQSLQSGFSGEVHPNLSDFDLFDGELLESDVEGKDDNL